MIVFTSSTSVYGNVNGTVKELPRLPETASGQVLASWKTGCTTCRGRRWIFCAWPGWWGRPVIRDVFAGKSALDGQHVVNLVHLQDVVAAIELLLQARRAGTSIIYVRPPSRRGLFYPQMARELGLPPPVFVVTAWTAAVARLWMAIESAMSWGLSTSTPIRW